VPPKKSLLPPGSECVSDRIGVAHVIEDRRRTGIFAWYNLVGSLATATGALVTGVWAGRDDRYSELRTASTSHLPKVEMFALGG